MERHVLDQLLQELQIYTRDNIKNESTKVQNPRGMCGLESDGIMTNCFPNDAHC